MKTGCVTAILLGVGAILLWFTTFALQSFAREAPDRSNAVQISLFLAILAAPALSYIGRRRVAQLPTLLLVVQLVLYVAYETGISIQTNIRIDLPLIYAAVLANAWLALRAIRDGARDSGSEATRPGGSNEM